MANKGRPESWGEPKQRVNISLTPTAIAGLDHLVKTTPLTRSEFVEHIGRGIIAVSIPPELLLPQYSSMLEEAESVKLVFPTDPCDPQNLINVQTQSSKSEDRRICS